MLCRIYVKPNSKRGPLVESRASDSPNPQHDSSDLGPEFIVYLRERPVDNAANLALIRLLAEYFHVPKSQVIIRRGNNSRHKLVEIQQ